MIAYFYAFLDNLKRNKTKKFGGNFLKEWGYLERKDQEIIDKMRYLSPSFGSPLPPPSILSRPSKTPPQTSINSILLSLVCAHEIWRCIPKSELASSHFLKFLFTTLNLIKMKSNRVDPSNLISKLGPFVSRARCAPFCPNEPNDVPEVLSFILTEMIACCPSSCNVFSLLYRIENFCDSCTSSSRSEDRSSILCVPVRRSINHSEFFEFKLPDWC